MTVVGLKEQVRDWTCCIFHLFAASMTFGYDLVGRCSSYFGNLSLCCRIHHGDSCSRWTSLGCQSERGHSETTGTLCGDLMLHFKIDCP